MFLSAPPPLLSPPLFLCPVTVPVTFVYSALSVYRTDDISHIVAEAEELEFHLPPSLDKQ